MLLGRRNDVLTKERLTGARWSFGHLHETPMTSAFGFGEDGLVTGYANANEHSWWLDDGILNLYNREGALTWRFEIVFAAADGLVLISQYQNDPVWRPFFVLTELAAAVPVPLPLPVPVAVPVAAGTAEPVRLVIWDLDDTFWEGTLSEGLVTPVAEHLLLVKTLNERGIMSSICSKNHFEPVRTLLVNLGVWDEFVFPEIAFAAKAPMVQRIVENAQLRPESILFIDDNVTNLNEARFYVPGLQIAEPSVIAGLLDDPRFKGKPDPEKTRLARYKILEQKAVEKAAASGDNARFLRDSAIRVSFHNDVEAEFARVHDLVNRTNQLNFTKVRWPEDMQAARDVFAREQALDFNSHAGYIKVSDRYGAYGICGYYHVVKDRCLHFLFSCRAMNMGVEQFVWNRLKRPVVQIVGDVISDLDMAVDWISVVADADAAPQGEAPGMVICIRGACDMSMTSNFLRTKAETLEELTYAWEGWEICSLPRILALHEEVRRPENQAIIARLPGMPAGRFDSDVIDGTSDAYVLSFSQESFHGLYRAKSTGMILPMGHFSIGHMRREKFDYTSMGFEEIAAAGIPGIAREEWEFFRGEFEFLGGFDEGLFVADVRRVFGMLREHRKPVVIIGLNEKVGNDAYILGFFGNINRIVKPLSLQAGFHYIDIDEYVRTTNDLAPDNVLGGAHFARHVYAGLAEGILGALAGMRVKRPGV
jgi:FkbH-like protein